MLLYKVLGENFKIVDHGIWHELGNGVSVKVFTFGKVPVLSQAQLSILFDCEESEIEEVVGKYQFFENGYFGIYCIKDEDAEDAYYNSDLSYDAGTEEDEDLRRITFYDCDVVLALAMYFRVSSRKVDSVLGYFRDLSDSLDFDNCNFVDDDVPF